MSGTSMDGIDVALVKTDGQNQVEFGPTMAVEYAPDFRKKLEQAMLDAVQIEDRSDRPAGLAELETALTDLHADAVRQFLQHNGLQPQDVHCLGFHGQTVLHCPHQGLTVQLGDGQRLANATGIDVVYDMRAEDMIAGGQGAPLVPVFHQTLARQKKPALPACFVNIGGISNITYVDDDALVAFDTGPGNALIDQWVQQKGGIPYDQGGRIASEGGIVSPIVDEYLAAAFFEKGGCKSLDRADFPPLQSDRAELSDGARTLARITAASIIKAIDHLPAAPATWILCGGGRLNDVIVSDMKDLASQTDGDVIVSDELGLSGDMIEAQAFAYLAVRSQLGLPLTYPTTTGCKQPTGGGVLARAEAL
ncbi:MAG: anhydro-N-acetylmuramic acid kinase [Hyphomicrobiales bacterium]|nr:anhydro-N-acetylmuramic acid kinase [Hyphomicrobiales bacterium]